jgi:DNA-binding response OmpR family regulator
MVPPVPAFDSVPPAALSARGALGTQERAVLSVLVANRNRVVSRRELSRQAGLAELSERRCDSVLVGLRRALGHDAIITVRSRGWMLAAAAAEAAAALL